MRKSALFILACLGTAGLTPQPVLASEPPARPTESYHPKVLEIVAEHAIPSAVLTFVEGDTATETIAIGRRAEGAAEPVSALSVYQIASVSKVFTGVIANALIASGELDPDAPVLTYLPEDLSDAARAKLTGVTVAHVLHHRSGLPRDTQVHPRVGNDPMIHPLTESDLLRDLAIADMVGAPGETYEYSNLGYGLLGYLLERASGESYARLLERVVTGPLGLVDTRVTPSAEMRARIVTPYRKEDPLTATSEWQTGKLVAASGLYSTAADLTRLLSAQLASYAGSEGEFDPLVLTEQTRPTGDGRQYGYGLNILPVTAGGETHMLHFHSGDMDGYAAFYGFIPARNAGFVLLVSRGGKGKDLLQRYALRRIMGLPQD